MPRYRVILFEQSPAGRKTPRKPVEQTDDRSLQEPLRLWDSVPAYNAAEWASWRNDPQIIRRPCPGSGNFQVRLEGSSLDAYKGNLVFS